MNRVTLGLLIAAAASAIGYWVKQNSSASAGSAASMTALSGPLFGSTKSSLDPDMVVTPKGDFDPKMIKTMPNVDPKMIVQPPAEQERTEPTPAAAQVADISVNREKQE